MTEPWTCCHCETTNIEDLSNPCPICGHERCGNCELGRVPNNSISRDNSRIDEGITTRAYVWQCCSCGGANSDLSTTCEDCGHDMDGNCVTQNIRSESLTILTYTNHSISPSKRNDEAWSCCCCGSANSWTEFCGPCGHYKCENCPSSWDCPNYSAALANAPCTAPWRCHSRR